MRVISPSSGKGPSGMNTTSKGLPEHSGRPVPFCGQPQGVWTAWTTQRVAAPPCRVQVDRVRI